MKNTITMHSVRAELVTDQHGPFVMLTDTDSCADSGAMVALHPSQLRFIAERFAGLEARHQMDPAGNLAHRLRLLTDHIEDLHSELLTSRASKYTDMSHELAAAGALLTIARAFTSDLPGKLEERPPVCPQDAEPVGAVAVMHATPEPDLDAQMGLDV